MTERDAATYQMLWDCPSCGTERLLGLDHRHCPSCGRAQDEEARYFPDKDRRIAVADHRFSGADRDCSSCSSPNAAASKHCVNCGQALEEAPEVKRVGARPAPTVPPRPGAPARIGWAPLLIGLGLLGFVVMIGINTCISESVEVTVTSRTWERSIAVEQHVLVTTGGWCDALAPGVAVTERSVRVRETRQVPDGETCVEAQRDNGDGTFVAYQECTPRTRAEDVAGDWCSFTEPRWQSLRTATARGEGSSTPAWPDAAIARPGDCVGCEREGVRDERYAVVVQGPDEPTTCAVTASRWADMAMGSRWTGDAAALSGNVRCGTLMAL